MDGTLTCAMHDFDAIKRELGLPLDQPILEAIDELPRDVAADVRRRLNRIELEMAGQAKPQPGAPELLELLVARQMPIGILTRNGKEIAHKTLEACGLIRFFPDGDEIVSRDCYPPKPNPAGVNHFIKRWNLPASQAVMVGDYIYDLEAGRNARTKTVHLDVDGIFPWPEKMDWGVTTLEQLARMLENN